MEIDIQVQDGHVIVKSVGQIDSAVADDVSP